MKINQIPDLYIEQYLLGELPENLRKKMDELIDNNSALKERIIKLKQSNEDILSVYPAEEITYRIREEVLIRKNINSGTIKDTSRERYRKPRGITAFFTDSLDSIAKTIRSVSARRYTISIVSAAAMIAVIVFMLPGIRGTVNISTPDDDTIRIKGLDSKLLLYRMKGREVEELKNFDTARAGDVIQIGYIATENYRYGIILSIDGRGTVTTHLPQGSVSAEKIVMNKRNLLSKSYELDDSPDFERFIMILSSDPVSMESVIEKAKKLAITREDALNGLIKEGKDSVEFSITIKKTR